MVHNQSEAPPLFRPVPYSLQLLQTLILQARQNAPRFMIRPNSERHLPQLRFGSVFHNPRLLVKLRLVLPLLRLFALLLLWLPFPWCCGWPLAAKRPFRRSMASSDFRRLKKIKKKIFRYKIFLVYFIILNGPLDWFTIKNENLCLVLQY